MDLGIYAVIEHRKLMELKNSVAVESCEINVLADSAFFNLRREIINVRKLRGRKGFFARLFDLSLPIEEEVKIMFGCRSDLVDHLIAIDVPSELAPITKEEKERLLFLDKAARCSLAAGEVLSMFRRHHEVMVGPELSEMIDWLLQNNARLRSELHGGV